MCAPAYLVCDVFPIEPFLNMQITRAGEYGVMGLMHLARCEPGQRTMIDQVSRKERIPKSFLAKIFQSLARAGLVRSIRGSGGGFALVKDPADISVLEIIEAVEGRIVFQRCKQAKPECEHIGGCALCGLFEQAQDGVKDALTRTSLRDLIRQQEAIDLTRMGQRRN
jgi:Rrf2 family transcriptional regulator, iron-sulfur cluster assembly transcription factor